MKEIALMTERPEDRIALRGLRVKSTVSGMSQKTTVDQAFVNLEDRAIEAIYTFPLPENSAVCGFEVVTADRTLTGVIDENDSAIETYDSAIDKGHGAFLLEQNRPDVFTVRVGNIKPKQAATIRITYVAQLDRVDKQIRIAFPTTIAPRFVSIAGTDLIDAAVDGDALNPPKAHSVPYGLSMEVKIDLGRPLTGIYSPSHSIRIERSNTGAAVLLEGGSSELNRDIVLTIDLPAEHEPSVQIQAGADGASYLAVTFVPEFDESTLGDPQPSETIFVLDCSGSMQGESIRQATAALELCLRSLNPGDSFNIVRFGSTFDTLSSEPLWYDESTLQRAIAHVRAPCDLGGTELYAPLANLFAQPVRTGALRQVILLTDGQISNEPAVLELARQHRAKNRLFTFGIGSACSAHLVKGLARATAGAAEFITEGERIEEKVLRTFSRLASPMMEDVSIDWGGADVQTLAEIPPVFDGDVLTIFGRVLGALPERVTLGGRLGRERATWAVRPSEISRSGGEDAHGTIALMWARRMIQSIEDVNKIQSSTSRRQPESKERQILVDLSKRFGLLSSLTTFVAVEHRSAADRTAGEPESRRVPVMLAKDWGGAGAGRVRMAKRAPSQSRRMASEVMSESSAMMDFDPQGSSASGESRFAKAVRKVFLRRAEPGKKSPPVKASERPPGQPPTGSAAQPGVPADPLQVLLSLQSADGWFDAPPEMKSTLAPRSAEVDAWAARVKDKVARGRLAPTVATLILLHTTHRDKSALWKRSADKALRWLSSVTGADAAEIEQFLQVSE